MTSAHDTAISLVLETAPERFLQPDSSLHRSAILIAKTLLDPLAFGISTTQTKRQREARKKRKRGDFEDEEADARPLALRSVHTEGFAADQIWEQARRVLDAAQQEVERDLRKVLEREERNVQRDISDDEVDDVDEEDDIEDEDLFDKDEGVGAGSSDDVDEAELVPDAEDIESIEDEDELELDEEVVGEAEPEEEFVEDPNGLNDGFFEIDSFNKQTQVLEQQDARSGEDHGVNDEEEVDWYTNPLQAPTRKIMPGLDADEAEDDDEMDEDDDEMDEEDGPTFGNADLNAPDSDDEDVDIDGDVDDLGGMGAMGNANRIMYKDFFAPPARKTKTKRARFQPHNFPSKAQSSTAPVQTDVDKDIERAMASVNRELFDESEPEDSGDENGAKNQDQGDPMARRSTHERRQAALAKEIAKLEKSNVERRSWQLSGEASAEARPLNSLLENDLDFERTGKPLPVITQEVTEDIEALIKRRIVNREFDEVVRRRPDDLVTGPQRRRFELSDSKPTSGLADQYADEMLRKNDPNYVDVRDEKLKKEHREIERMWKDISGKLDALSSWHYKPKPAAPSLEVRVDAPTITMEDARPTAGADLGAATSMLAPQELYMPGEQRSKVEITTRGGAPIAKVEMTREEKKRERRRKKEKLRKAGIKVQRKVDSDAAKTRKPAE